MLILAAWLSLGGPVEVLLEGFSRMLEVCKPRIRA